MHKHSFVLASNSPRRLELLKLAGFQVTQLSVPFVEELNTEIPIKRAIQEICDSKFEQAKALVKPSKHILITADTMVELNGYLLGKPQNAEDAFQMLRALSGNYHSVYTAVCMGKTLPNTDDPIRFVERTKVYMEDVSDAFIQAYIDKVKPFDKAGAYGIQDIFGVVAVNRIEGCYYNVMGLPVSTIVSHLDSF